MGINYPLLRNFYRNKKVLITGHTGFKGSWLSIWLQMLGADVAGCSLDPLTPLDNFTLCELNSVIKDYRVDVRNLDRLKDVIALENPDIIFHLAAQALVIESYLDPIITLETNIIGTANLLEACRLNNKERAIVVVTSDKCYENKEWIYPYRESDPMGGYDPYSASKGAAELICASYRNSFFTPLNKSVQRLATARAGNVFGGGDWAQNRIIPDCVRAIEAGIPLVLRNPKATRPWQHVLEPLGGYLLLGMKSYENQLFADSWNFGPGIYGNYTVKDVVESFFYSMGNGCWRLESNQEFHEANMLALDITKSANILGWQPVLNFNDAIRLTAEWYQNYKSCSSVLDLCRKQISYYENYAGSGKQTITRS